MLQAKLEKVAREQAQSLSASAAAALLAGDQNGSLVVEFRAQPLPHSHRVPFQPVFDHAEQHLTTPAPFTQASDVRAAARREFDEQMAARAQAEAAARAAADAEKKAADEAAVKAMRKAMEFKVRRRAGHPRVEFEHQHTDA